MPSHSHSRQSCQTCHNKTLGSRGQRSQGSQSTPRPKKKKKKKNTPTLKYKRPNSRQISMFLPSSKDALSAKTKPLPTRHSRFSPSLVLLPGKKWTQKI